MIRLREKVREIADKINNLRFVVNYRRMWPYVKPYWFRALLAVTICIPIGALDAVIALSLKPYMDLVMVEKSVQSPWYIPFGIVAFTSIQGGLNYLATYLNTWVGAKITNGLKFTLYQKMLTLQTSFFDKRKSGDVIFAFNNNADMACSGLLDNLKVFTQRLFSSISLVGVLFYNSWQLALIAVAVLGFAFLPVARIRKRINDVMSKTLVADASVITAYNEAFSGNKTITAYNLQPQQTDRFFEILKGIFTLRIKLVQKTSWLSPMMHVVVSVGIGLAIGYGSHLILTGKITSGNFVSFITALIMLYSPVKSIGNNFNQVQLSFFAIERVFDMLDMEPEIKDKENAKNMPSDYSEIEFNNVNFEYTPNVPVLKNINLRVKKGETVAFVGNSGGGKTTIVNLLPRFYDVKSGSITVDGTDIRDFSLKSLRGNISVVFQDNFLFSGTIRENILLGNENATEEMLQKAVKAAYLDDFIAELEKGLDTFIGERGILLSGGQKQRVAIARAFYRNSDLLILDEPSSALDPLSEYEFYGAVDNAAKDKTLITISHRLSSTKNADKILVLENGSIIESGTHDQLMDMDGVYSHMFTLQSQYYNVILSD